MTFQALPATFNSEPLYKEQFAASLYAGYTPFLAALKIWPNHSGFAYQTAQAWERDPYVLEHVAKLRAEAEAALRPPTKEEFLRSLHDRMQGMSDDEYIKAAKVYAEVASFIEKPAPAQINNNVNNNTFEKVMIVKDHGSDDQWAEKLKAQQAKLIESK